jgi:hypothetical protein
MFEQKKTNEALDRTATVSGHLFFNKVLTGDGMRSVITTKHQIANKINTYWQMCLILLSLINFCSIKEKFTRFI